MAKFLVFAIFSMVAAVLAEPPSSYLPPQARNSPSSTYGAPNGGNGGFRSNGKSSSFHAQRTGSKSFSYNSLHENQFGGSMFGKSFGGGFGSAGAPSQQYGAPSQSYRAPSNNGAGQGGNGFGLSQQYGAPSFGASDNGFGNNGYNKGFDANGANNGFGLSQQYGAPSFDSSSNGFGNNGYSKGFGGNGAGNGFSKGFGGNGASNGYSKGFGGKGASNGFGGNGVGNGFSKGFGGNGASNGYSKGFGGNGAGNGFGLSQQYGAPGFGSSEASNHRFGSSGARFSGSSSYSAPAPVYGAPSPKYGVPKSKMDDDLAEPANYEYTYEVRAAEESGAEFGHQESREDEAAKGVYHVLLPDGRTQIVEYEADEEGFRPVIRYEEPSGYPEARGPQGPY